MRLGGAGDRGQTCGEGKMNRRRRRRERRRLGRDGRRQGRQVGGLPWWVVVAAVGVVALFALSRVVR